jgi:hypothetical protein
MRGIVMREERVKKFGKGASGGDVMISNLMKGNL